MYFRFVEESLPGTGDRTGEWRAEQNMLRTGLNQAVDHFHQRFPVVEGFRSVQSHMGFNARIDAVKGTVVAGVNLQRAGHLVKHARSLFDDFIICHFLPRIKGFPDAGTV